MATFSVEGEKGVPEKTPVDVRMNTLSSNSTF